MTAPNTRPRLALFSHPSCARHETGAGHPERPERVAAVRRGVLAAGLGDALVEHEAPRANDEQLLRVHTAAHLAAARAHAPAQGLVHWDADTAMGPNSLEAALRAAGAGVAAVDLVLGDGDGCRAAFCNVRPPGHHAEPARAMGFCLFSNVAVAAAHALAQHGLDRVAIADFDVHHGNGTEAALGGRRGVLFCSSFEENIYPYPDLGGADNVLKVPLSRRASAEQLRQQIADAFCARLREFAPQLLLISAGFDAHSNDPLAGLCLRDEDYGWLTGRLLEAVAPSADGRVVSMLEGGYDLQALEGSVAAHVGALAGGAAAG